MRRRPTGDWRDDNYRKMREEADWWKGRHELARDMVGGFLGFGLDGESLLDDMHREQEGAKAATRQYHEYWERRERLRMPFEQLRRDPKLWAETRRDVNAVLGKIAQGASHTVGMLEVGLLPTKSIEQLRQALAAHDAAVAEEVRAQMREHPDGNFSGDGAS